MRGESGISLTGLYICGAITFVMLVLKLSVIDTWSWWRVILPLGLIVGFNVTNIVVAFIYLLFTHIPERPDGDEADVLEPHTINVHYVAAMLFFVVFGDNVVRWIEGSETSQWIWLFRARAKCSPCSELSVCSLCSRTGQGLDGC